jgi:hypothetical protein
MAGRTLIVCTLALAVSTVRAELPRAETADPAPQDAQIRFVRRPVAVIDLSNEQVVRDVASKLLDQLASHTELQAPAISDAAALFELPPLDDERRIREAQSKLNSAALNLAQRAFREAAIDAVEGQQQLLHVTPRAALALYADLALALGQSRLGEKRDAEAREAFALAYRLDPRRTLDDLHYLPEVVQTFEAAKKVHPEVGMIQVRGQGRVWIDGEEVGKAPGEFRASVGLHVVWLTDLLRETGGKEVRVTRATPGDATIMDGALNRPQKVVRYRLRLARASDAAQRATAMKDLAAFVNVHDAVLLSLTPDRKIQWQTWRDRAPGFSAFRELANDNPMEILKQLAPPPPVEEPEPEIVQPYVPPVRWYQRRPVQVGVAVAIVAAIVSGYLVARYTEPDRGWVRDITFDSMPRRAP